MAKTLLPSSGKLQRKEAISYLVIKIQSDQTPSNFDFKREKNETPQYLVSALKLAYGCKAGLGNCKSI